MYAELNSRVKLCDLIQGVIVQSANDACIAIAEGMAGSEEAFAEQMTRRARELGLTKSVFKNATGLPDPEHKMTVRELAMLAQYIIRTFPEYYHYYSQPSFTWNNITQQNRNPLLTDYPGADGMKTGYTKRGGLRARRLGRARRAAADHGRSPASQSLAERKQEAQKLLDWGFRQFKPVMPMPPMTGWRAPASGAASRLGRPGHPRGRAHSAFALEQEQIEVELHYIGPLIAPVKPRARRSASCASS